MKPFNILLSVNFIVSSTFASAQQPEKQLHNVDENALALKGYDPVSYFETNAPVLGEKENSVAHEGMIFYFSTKSNRAKFKQNPQKYIPKYGGFCALGLGAKSGKYGFTPERFDINPLSYKIIEDKLYLFYNTPAFDAKAIWDGDDEVAMIQQADSLWSIIKTRHTAQKLSKEKN